MKYIMLVHRYPGPDPSTEYDVVFVKDGEDRRAKVSEVLDKSEMKVFDGYVDNHQLYPFVYIAGEGEVPE